MEQNCLIMKWKYFYDKESTWFDEDQGEERLDLIEGAAYPLPHIGRKKIEIISVETEGEAIQTVLYVDSHSVTVCSGGEPVVAHASDSYSVAGDSVHQSLCLSFTIEKK